MNFAKIIAIFRGRKSPANIALIVPDPEITFPHPGNAELFACLKESSKVAGPDNGPLWVREGYEIRSHPDLESYLFSLITEEGLRKGFAFGRPVIANSGGLVFAWAGGTHYIWLRLNEERHNDARLDGGRFDPSYGKDWVEFRVGGRHWSPSNWRDAMERWARTSYQDGARMADRPSTT